MLRFNSICGIGSTVEYFPPKEMMSVRFRHAALLTFNDKAARVRVRAHLPDVTRPHTSGSHSLNRHDGAKGLQPLVLPFPRPRLSDECPRTGRMYPTTRMFRGSDTSGAGGSRSHVPALPFRIQAGRNPSQPLNNARPVVVKMYRLFPVIRSRLHQLLRPPARQSNGISGRRGPVPITGTEKPRHMLIDCGLCNSTSLPGHEKLC